MKTEDWKVTMKTKYGKKLLREATLLMTKDRNRMAEIAKEFQAAKQSDWEDEKFSELMDEFEELEKVVNARQQIINVMIRIEGFVTK